MITHARHDGLCPKHRSQDVDLEATPPHLRVGVLDERKADDAGVGDQQVDRSERGFGDGDSILSRPGCGDIGNDRLAGAAKVCDQRGRLVELALAASDGHHRGSQAAQLER
jgi:hypothetical protein